MKKRFFLMSFFAVLFAFTGAAFAQSDDGSASDNQAQAPAATQDDSGNAQAQAPDDAAPPAAAASDAASE